VLTTGATAREAQRALAAAGVPVAAIAAVAATPRRAGGRGP
jgi:predicted amidophosphoribosyltransferase